MASQTIKGLTVQISGDTTNLGKAVKEAEDKSKALGRELTEVNKLLKQPDADAVELLAQKQQILTDRVAATKDKLDTLKEAEAQVQEQFERGEITTEQYRAFQREIMYTANEMAGYEKAVDKVSQQLAEAKVKTGEEANSLEELRAKISLQEKELSGLKEEYKAAVVAEGENSETAKKLKEKYNQLNTELSSNRQKMTDAEKAADSLGKAEKTALTPIEALKKTISEQEKELSTLKDRYKSVVLAEGENSDSAKELKEKISSLSSELKDNQQKLEDTEKSADEFDHTLDEVSDDADQAAKDVDDVGDAAEKSESGFNKAASAVGNFISQLALDVLQKAAELMKQLVSDVLESGMAFESSMSKVQALSGASADEMEKLSETAKEYGKETVFSASQSADALSYMALAGWKVDDMIDGLPGVLNLAAASEMDLARASDIVTDYMTAFGWEASRAGDFADRMAFAMANSNTSTEALGEAYKNCAATANSMHYSMEEVTAAVMTMANAGVKGGESGTALNALMTRLATDTKGCATELEQYGVSIYDSKGNMQSLSSILTGISETWEDLTDEQQANLAKIIAGQNQYSSFQTIMQGLSDTAKESGSSFEDYTEALNNCSGTAAEMSATMVDNLQGDIKMMQSAYEGLQIAIYEGANAPLRDVVQLVTNEVLPAFTDLVNGVDGAGGAVGEALGNLITKILDEILNLLPTVAEIGGTLIMTLISTFTEQLPAVLESAYSIIDMLITGITEALPSLTEMLATIINDVISFVVGHAGDVMQMAVGLIQALAEGMTTALPILLDGLSDMISMLSEGLLSHAGELLQAAVDLLMAVVDAVPVLAEVLLSALPDLITDLVNALLDCYPVLLQGILSALPVLLNTVQILIAGIIEALPEIINTLLDAIPELIDMIADYLIQGIPVIVDAAVSLLMGIVDALPEIFSMITDVLTDSLPEILGSILNLLVNLTPVIIEAIITLMEAVSQAIPEIANAVGSALPGLIQAILNFLIQSIPTILQALQTILESIISALPGLITPLFTMLDALFSPFVMMMSEWLGNIWNAVSAWLSETWSNISQSISNAWENLKQGAENTLNSVIEFFSQLPETIGYIIGTVIGTLARWAVEAPEKAREAGEQFIEKVVTFFSELPGKVSEALESAIAKVNQWKEDMIQKATETAENFQKSVQKFFDELPGKLKKTFDTAVQRVTEWGSSMKTKAHEAASNAVSTITNLFETLPQKIYNTGKNLISGLWNGIVDMKNWLLNKISDFCGGVLNGFLNAFDIHSPSRKMAWAGRMLNAGLVQGMEDTEDDPISTIEQTARKMLDTAFIPPEQISAEYNQQNTFIPESIQIVDTSLLEKLDSILQAIERGQVLVIDSNKLVGATADKMNIALGQIQAVSARRL